MSGKLSLSIFFALFVSALCDTTQESQKISKVNVTIYYEALCTDSAKFITTMVYPVIANQSSSLAQFLNVTFVPFGKSQYNITSENKTDAQPPLNVTDVSYKFECHHGEEECQGNMYQACAIEHIKDKTTLYKYINCTMATGHMHKNSNYSVGKGCAEELKLDATALLDCANGIEGSKLLAHYGDLTIPMKLKVVPEITFNDVYTEAKQKEAEKNLKGVLCKEIPNSHKLVSECAAIPNSAPSVLAASMVMMVAAFAASRVY